MEIIFYNSGGVKDDSLFINCAFCGVCNLLIKIKNKNNHTVGSNPAVFFIIESLTIFCIFALLLAVFLFYFWQYNHKNRAVKRHKTPYNSDITKRSLFYYCQKYRRQNEL